jgi:hypothetical protein
MQGLLVVLKLSTERKPSRKMDIQDIILNRPCALEKITWPYNKKLTGVTTPPCQCSASKRISMLLAKPLSLSTFLLRGTFIHWASLRSLAWHSILWDYMYKLN